MVKLENRYTRMCRFDQNINEIYCECDFRINIYRCDNKFFAKASWVTLTLTSLNVIMGIAILYYLIKVKKQPLFLPSTRERGIIRPRPVHSFQLIALLYNAALLFNVICLITESYPYVIYAELGHFLPLAICVSLAIFCPISLIYSTPNIGSDPEGSSVVTNKTFIDVIGFIFMIHPYLFAVPTALLSGYYADRDDIKTAIIYFKIHFLSWTIFSIIYILLVVYFYCRLINVINCQIENQLENQRRVREVNSNNVVSGYDINTLKRAKRNFLEHIHTDYRTSQWNYGLLQLTAQPKFQENQIKRFGMDNSFDTSIQL
ncbi:1796_t:CDS:2 [Funneliformis geosporum]|uniref:1796_t:CDS:1 n=1 Tax=Funneliformis geosporum TaxID=1117311 RepID=A0A9W4SCS2_9GLOM|nr:1796_t:CDS:2 [Funneliformis geosporum]